RFARLELDRPRLEGRPLAPQGRLDRRRDLERDLGLGVLESLPLAGELDLAGREGALRHLSELGALLLEAGPLLLERAARPRARRRDRGRGALLDGEAVLLELLPVRGEGVPVVEELAPRLGDLDPLQVDVAARRLEGLVDAGRDPRRDGPGARGEALTGAEELV